MEMSNYDKRHLQHLQKVEQRIQKLYHAAIERIAKLVNTATRIEDSTYRLEEDKAVHREVQRILSTLASDTETAITNGIKDEWYLSDEKNAALMRSVFGSHQPKEEPQAYLTNRSPALKAFLKRKSKGLDLSDRVWKLTKEYKHEIEYALEIAIREGKSAAQTASLMKRYLNRPNELYRRVRNKQGKLVPSKRAKQYHPGQGIYRSSYQNARRLAATETNIAYRTADHVRWMQMDFVVGIKINLSNNHTCNGRPFHDICDELVGVYPKTFKFGGWHPLCRCFATPILKTEEEMEEDDRRLARGEAPTTTSKNEVTELPKAFEDWYKRNADKLANADARGKAPYFFKDNKELIHTDQKTKYIQSNPNESILLTYDDLRAYVSQERITEKIYSKDGEYISYRKILHEQIISDYLDVEKVHSDKVYMLGGAPANGKSTVVNSGSLPYPSGALVIDADKVKGMIPEYKMMLASGDKGLIKAAANFVHEESSYLGKAIQRRAFAKNYGVVIDGVNDGSFDKVVSRVRQIRQMTGKPVRADYVSLDSELSVKLAKARAEATGREVPLDYLLRMNSEISRLIPQLIEYKTFDELYLWDTNINGLPRLILKQTSGMLEILDQGLYKKFLRKADRWGVD